MNIILWIIFGAVVGFITNFITGNKGEERGCISSVIVGILGSFVGGSLVHLFQTGNLNIIAASGFDLASIVVSVLGSILLLFILDRLS